MLAREQVEAEDKEHVLRAVATAATRMRATLGESLASIQKLNVPSQQVTTTSLEAFQAYALGRAQIRPGLYLAAIPFFQRATNWIRTSPRPMSSLGIMYGNVGEIARCVEYLRRGLRVD